MIDQIRRVAELRDSLRRQKDDRDMLYHLWLENNKIRLDALDNTAQALAEAEASLRASAVAAFMLTGKDALPPGVEVKVMGELRYDEKEALAWAIKHEVALSLDRKVFEKVAKATPPDFVELALVPKAFIAADLSKVLAEALPAQS